MEIYGYKKIKYIIIHNLTPIKVACLNTTKHTTNAYMHICADTFTHLESSH